MEKIAGAKVTAPDLPSFIVSSFMMDEVDAKEQRVIRKEDRGIGTNNQREADFLVRHVLRDCFGRACDYTFMVFLRSRTNVSSFSLLSVSNCVFEKRVHE